MKKFILASLMVGCLSISAAYAAKLECEQQDNGAVTVNASGLKKNAYVSMTVYSEMTENGETKKYIKQIDEVKSDSAGNATFKFEFFVTDPIAKYTLSVQDESMADEAETMTIEFKNQLAVDLINDAENSTALLGVLKKNSTVLNIDTGMLNEDNEERIAKALFEKKSDYTTENFDKFRELYFDIAVTDLVNAADEDDLEEIFGKYPCGADVSEQSDYSKLSDEGKKELLARISEKTFENAEDIADTWKEQIGLTIIKTVKYPASASWITNGESVGLKENYEEILDFGGGKYSLLKDKNAPYKALAGKDFKDKQTAKSAFEKACDDQYKQENKSAGGSGGTGGGGGGMPAVALNPENQANKEITPKEYYNDISAYSWAKEAIEKLTDKSIISGNGAGMFMPEKEVTREEFLKMLVSALELPAIESEKRFDDVPEDVWYKEYVQTGVEVGIINGIAENTFGSGMPITREDMAVMIERASKIAGIELRAVEEKIDFEDEQNIAEYAKTSVEKVQMAGIINGYEDLTFKPQKTATRAESAVVIYKFTNIK